MSFTLGARLGAYEVLSAIGQGGMGEVYRAKDTKLGRAVALKILPEQFATDLDRLARFKREAQVLASLNHPNIGGIYGLEEANGVRALVLELVEGETLADRIARGPVPLNEALPIAKQIAEALEGAHEHGIIHRDLKPSNIKLRPDGTVKVLDFGLAKALEPALVGADASQSPTITSPAMTRAGIILGTAAYMSPEQARGNPVDKRTDIWAFGCVLFEMLTGRRVFAGETLSDTIAAILERDPDWRALPANTPTLIRRLVRRSLEKDRKRRLPDIGVAQMEIDEAITSPAWEQSLPAPTARGRERIVWALGAMAVLTIGALAIPATFYFRRAAPEPVVTRLDVVTPTTSDPFSFALSPDGRQLVFVANGERGSQLWLRPLGQVGAQPLAGTEGAVDPFWAPDGRVIGFFADGKLKRIDLAGGAPQVIADAPTGRGGTWNREGLIVFASTFNAGLKRVEASGGLPIPVTRLASGQSSHRWPQFLPDGRRFLFFGIAEQEPGRRGVFVGSLDGGEPTRVLADNAPATYAPPGYLLQVSDGVLMAHRFDGARGPVSAESVLVAQPVASDARIFRAAVSVSEGGVLAYRSSAAVRRQLVWVDRTGKTLSIPGLPDETGVDFGFELAPDGERVAGQRIVQQNSDIWITDIVRGISSRFTVDPVLDSAPLWSRDGTRLVFSSLHNGTLDLFEKPLNSASDKRPVLVSADDKTAQDWSWDGRVLLYAAQQPTTRVDLWALPLTGERKPFPVAQTGFDEAEGRFSPDGRWVAYTSNETGRSEIYVRAFPGPGDKWQVSKGGGNYARWRRDGRELFYLTLDKRLMAAPIQIALDGRMLSPGASVELFQTRLAISGANASLGVLNSRAEYAVAPDGRFLMNIAADDAVTSPINVVLNWTVGLKK